MDLRRALDVARGVHLQGWKPEWATGPYLAGRFDSDPLRYMTLPDSSDDTPTTPLQAAEMYASLGWRVVPIAPGTRHPAGLGKWQDAATDNLDTIRSWWTDLYRGYGIGIATGPGSGVWALDIDVKEGKEGRASFEALEAEHGELPPTPTTITGSGGLHLYFQWDDEHPVHNWQEGPKVTSTPFGPGIDIRGDRGQVVAWPTIHPDSGTLYQWAPDRAPWQLAPAEAPAWLYERLERDRNPRATGKETDPAPASVKRRHEGIHDAAADRHNSPDSAADHIRETHRFDQVLQAEGWTWHHDQGQDSYWTRPGKDPRKGHSGCLHNNGDGPFVVFSTEISAGLASAGQTTFDGTGVSFTVFDFIAGTRHNGDKSALARAEREDLNRNRPTVDRTTPKPRGVAPDSTKRDPDATEGDPEEDQPSEIEHNRHRRALLTEEGLASLKPPKPIAVGWLYLMTLAVLYGPPKKGKTFVAIDLAMSVATGTDWLGGPVRPGNVVYCLGEGVAGMHRRIKAWRTHRGVSAPANLTILPHTPQLGNGVDVGDFLEVMEDVAPDLIIIDTLARASVGVQENDAMEMGRVIAEADRIKDATGACVLIVHHTGKDSSRGTRGSSALTGAIDTGIEVQGDPQAMTLVNTEQKDAAPADELQFRYEAVGDSIVFVPTLDVNEGSRSTREAMDALLAIDLGATTNKQWEEECETRGVSRSSLTRAKKWLVDNGLIANVGTPARPLWTAGIVAGIEVEDSESESESD